MATNGGALPKFEDLKTMVLTESNYVEPKKLIVGKFYARHFPNSQTDKFTYLGKYIIEPNVKYEEIRASFKNDYARVVSSIKSNEIEDVKIIEVQQQLPKLEDLDINHKYDEVTFFNLTNNKYYAQKVQQMSSNWFKKNIPTHKYIYLGKYNLPKQQPTQQDYVYTDNNVNLCKEGCKFEKDTITSLEGVVEVQQQLPKFEDLDINHKYDEVTFSNLNDKQYYAQKVQKRISRFKSKFDKNISPTYKYIYLGKYNLPKQQPIQQDYVHTHTSNNVNLCEEGCQFEKGTITSLEGVVEVQPPTQNDAPSQKGGKSRKTIRRKSKKRKTRKMRKTRK
jgi:hypothetical protein